MTCLKLDTSTENRQAIWAAMNTITYGLRHELRNPLCSLELRLRVLQAKYGESISEDHQQGLDEVKNTIGRLGEIVERLCAFSPTETTHSVPVDPEILLADVRDNLGPTPAIQVDTQCQGTLSIDPDDLGTALQNLIRNAQEACGPEGEVTVTLSQHGHSCLIEINDNGPGIPLEIQDRIGQPFVTGKPAGEGMGLGICQAMILLDRHGASLTIPETGPLGTTVLVNLLGFEPRSPTS